jgi:hypothetical protein
MTEKPEVWGSGQTPGKKSTETRQLAATTYTSNQITLKRSTFSAPGGSGQIRLINIKKIEMSELNFTALLDSNAVQGGSIYCRDCFQISISKSKFQGQVTKLAGGAIYLEQTSAPKYANSRTAANVF